MEDGDEVTSEVHLGCSPREVSCLSIFTIAASPLALEDDCKCQLVREQCTFGDFFGSMQHKSSMVADVHGIVNNSSMPDDDHVIVVDESGDLVIPRRKKKRMYDVETKERAISLYHHVKTTIPYVGLQIWKASLLLGDYLLHKMHTTSELDNVIVLELGTGTGILGILLAAKARLVILTDLEMDVLDNCYRNVLLNSKRSERVIRMLRIRQLDWQEQWPPSTVCFDGEKSANSESFRYAWCEADIKELGELNIILAADVIYSDSLTDGFFNLLKNLMPPGSQRLLWLALEKRFNFSFSNLDVVAHGYEHFLSFLEDRTNGSPSTHTLQDHKGHKMFAGKRLHLNQIPQSIREYERTNDLELWEIWRI